MSDRRSFLLRTTPAAVASAALGGMAGAGVKLAIADEPDPVFAAIAEHARLFRAADALADIEGEAYDVAIDAEEAALQALSRTPPTTVAGAAALLTHMIRRERAHVDDGSPFLPAVETVVAALAAMGGARV